MEGFQVTQTFIDAALRAAADLSEDAAIGVPIPEMDGYFIIQEGRKPNGDTIVTTLEAEGGKRYDVYVLSGEHEDA